MWAYTWGAGLGQRMNCPHCAYSGSISMIAPSWDLNRNPGYTYQGVWGQLWLTMKATTLSGGSPRETDLNELSWGSTFWHQDLATPNNLQARAESLRPNNNQDGTQPITENRMLKVILNSQPPKNTPHDMALLQGTRTTSTHQWVSTNPSTKSLHKPLDQLHPPGSRYQNKRN